jgi:hypothetical protein
MFNPEYNLCVELFKTKSGTHIGSWLNISRVFKFQGKYGITGLATHTENDKLKFVFKISKYSNNNIKHEYNIMHVLNDMRLYCPHFCKPIGLVECELTEVSKKMKSFKALDAGGGNALKTDILLSEFVGRVDMELFIKDLRNSDFAVLSILKQLILGLSMAQKSHKLTHYDLHLSNIMIGNCHKNDVFVYVIDDTNQFCVPTHGHFPIIIDYGFSFVENKASPELLVSMEHTHYGYTCCDFDDIVDIQRFMFSACVLIMKYRNSTSTLVEFKKLERIIKNIFVCTRKDIVGGLNSFKDCDAYQTIIDVVKPVNVKSTIFAKDIVTCIELMQKLVSLPVCDLNTTNDDLVRAHTCIDDEWSKIERMFSKKESYKLIYVFRAMVDSANDVKIDYVSDSDISRDTALSNFKKSFYTQVATFSKFCSMTDVNFDILLCSLFIYATCIETVVFKVSNRVSKIRQKHRKRMPVSQPEQIYGALEANFKDPFAFEEGVNVHVLDRIKKTTTVYTPTREKCEDINKVHNLSKGTFIYDSLQIQNI